MSAIHFSEMVKDMDQCSNGRSIKTFQIVFVTHDERRDTGGKLTTIEKGQKTGLPYHCADHEMRGIVDMESGKRTAFHLRLVLEYNGMTVYW